jgi:hypothetical protein
MLDERAGVVLAFSGAAGPRIKFLRVTPRQLERVRRHRELAWRNNA